MRAAILLFLLTVLPIQVLSAENKYAINPGMFAAPIEDRSALRQVFAGKIANIIMDFYKKETKAQYDKMIEGMNIDKLTSEVSVNDRKILRSAIDDTLKILKNDTENQFRNAYAFSFYEVFTADELARIHAFISYVGYERYKQGKVTSKEKEYLKIIRLDDLLVVLSQKVPILNMLYEERYNNIVIDFKQNNQAKFTSVFMQIYFQKLMEGQLKGK